jgi:hypothetical protein
LIFLIFKNFDATALKSPKTPAVMGVAGAGKKG